MAAYGSASDSQESLDISGHGNDSQSSLPTLDKDYNLIGHLKANKSKFSWLGSFEQLLQFAEEQLGLNRESMKVSENETKKTIKTEQVILNWFYSTGTLQVQGPQAANFKGFLTKLLGAESSSENAFLRPPQHNASSQEANLTFAVNLDTEHIPHETVPLSVFTEEIKNIWSEIKTIGKKLGELHQSKENEKERNGNQEIHTLQQKNQDLQNEICMLKNQLREQNNVLKNISEERDSYRTALQIMTKEVNAHKEKDLSSQPVSADPDAEQGGWSIQQNTRHNRRSSRSTKSSPNSEDSHSGANNNNEHGKKPVTVIAGDSIIQHIRGWSISRSNKVVVKSFPGATIEDMKDFVKPLLRKKPDNVVLHIGTNDLNTREPRLTAEGIVNLALQIEGDAPETKLAISGLIARADDKDGKVSSVNKILKKFCRQNHWNFIEHNNINQTHLNRGGLHLSKSGSAILAQNFCKHMN